MKKYGKRLLASCILSSFCFLAFNASAVADDPREVVRRRTHDYVTAQDGATEAKATEFSDLAVRVYEHEMERTSDSRASFIIAYSTAILSSRGCPTDLARITSFIYIDEISADLSEEDFITEINGRIDPTIEGLVQTLDLVRQSLPEGFVGGFEIIENAIRGMR